jgi:hypothetical protein
MTVCPIAVVAGCEKCPALRICPLKTLLGDYRAEGKKKAAGKAQAAKAPEGARARKK